MVSESKNISSARVQVLPTPAPVATAAATPVAASPKVSAPKPVQLQFDEAKNRKNVQDAVSALNEQMAATKTGLGFHMDEAVGGPVVTVRSAETGEVVRQIPNEVVVQVAHSIDALKGLLLNAKV